MNVSQAIIVLSVLIGLFLLVLLFAFLNARKLNAEYADTESSHKAAKTIDILKSDDFETILAKFDVPKDHYKVVIAQSRIYAANNCPAVLWKDESKIKVLLLRAQPVLTEEDIEDFQYITSSPYVNFRQFDGTYFPDWAAQSKEIKELFLPYIEMGVACGGIDYDRQTYWAGTMCVYSKSLAEILRMLDKPLSYYEIRVDNVKRMKEDGSIPPEMLAEREAEKRAAAKEAAAAEQAASSKDMDAVWEAIKRLESKSREEISTEEINKLNAYLLAEKRYEDLERSTKDKDFQKELLKELAHK